MALTPEQREQVKQRMIELRGGTSAPQPQQRQPLSFEEFKSTLNRDTGRPQTTEQEEDTRGFFGKARDFLLPGVRGFGESIGDALISNEGLAGDIARKFTGDPVGRVESAEQDRQRITGDLIQRIREKRARGEDTSRLESTLSSVGGRLPTDISEITPSVDKSRRQVVGEAIGTGASIAGFGSLPGAGSAVGTSARAAQSGFGGFLRGAGRGAIEGSKLGAGFGAVEGFAQGLREDMTTGESLRRGAVTGAIGGVAGGVLGGAAGGIGGSISARQARKAELNQIFDQTGPSRLPPQDPGLPPSAEITSNESSAFARFTRNEAGDIVKDRNAQTLIRGASGNVDEASIVAIKQMSKADRAKAQKMIDFAEKAQNNRRFTKRPTDVVGETIVDYTETVQRANQNVGKKLDDVALKLKGEDFNFTTPENQFIDDLQRAGVTFDEAGTPQFQGSDFEDIPGAENLITKVVKRLREADGAYDAHRLKKYIDNLVSYGRRSEGLVGQAETIVKNLRRNVDTGLDTKFPDYNNVNTEYAQTINILDQVYEALGRKFKIGDGFDKIRAGQAARRISGNSQRRGEIQRTLDLLEQEAVKRGAQGDQSIISQVVFADVLEDIFGTQATTGLAGSIERGTTRAARGVLGNLAQGNIRGAAGAGVEAVADAALSTTQDDLVNALRNLIQ